MILQKTSKAAVAAPDIEDCESRCLRFDVRRQDLSTLATVSAG